MERQDLLVEPLEAPLALADDLRLKRTIPVARRADADRAVLGHQRFRFAPPVARVPGPARRLLMRLVTEMVGQLDLHRALHQPLGQLAKKPALTEDLLL